MYNFLPKYTTKWRSYVPEVHANRGSRGSDPRWNLVHQLTLFKPGGTDYAQHSIDCPPGFKKLSTPKLILGINLFPYRKLEEFLKIQSYHTIKKQT